MDDRSHAEALIRFSGKPPALWRLPFLSVRLLVKSRSSERQVALALFVIRFILLSAHPPFRRTSFESGSHRQT